MGRFGWAMVGAVAGAALTAGGFYAWMIVRMRSLGGAGGKPVEYRGCVISAAPIGGEWVAEVSRCTLDTNGRTFRAKQRDPAIRAAMDAIDAAGGG